MPMKTNAAALRKLSQYGHTKRHQRSVKAKARAPTGWATYTEYLTTEHWQYMRQRMLVRAHYTCDFCGARRQLQVHHKTYDRIGRERANDLVVLCADCHERVHQLHRQNPAMSLRDATNLAKRRTKLVEFEVVVDDRR